MIPDAKSALLPYGLNFTSEVMSDDALINHCKMVLAIREDLGL